MEIIFNFIAEGFASFNTVGMLVLALALCGLSVVGYLCFLTGAALWAFVEDKEWLDLVADNSKRANFIKSTSKRTLGRYDSEEHWIKLKCDYGVRWFYKNSIVYDTVMTPKYLIKLGIYIGSVATVLVAMGMLLDIFALFPILTTLVLSGVGLLFLARGVRRLQKKLNFHLNDKDAHKAQEEENV